MNPQTTRKRYYPGFGTALEVQSQSESSRWFHLRWVAGPAYQYQENVRRAVRREAMEVTPQ